MKLAEIVLTHKTYNKVSKFNLLTLFIFIYSTSLSGANCTSSPSNSGVIGI